MKNKNPQSFIKTKKLSHKKKLKKKLKIYVFGRISRISYDPTRSYVRSYHFSDPSAILNVLVRYDHKIVRSYDPYRNFDNYALYVGFKK